MFLTLAVASETPRRRVVACPTCRGDSAYAAGNPFRPFCSQRCKNNDFGAWASEAFRVAAPLQRADDEPEDPAAASQ